MSGRCALIANGSWPWPMLPISVRVPPSTAWRDGSDIIKDGIITRWDLSIQEDDFQAVLSLAEPMYLHAVHILSFLPANEVKNRGMADQERLFITLDTGFTYQSLLEEAEKLKIPKNTACSCLQRWQKQGIVRKGEKRGDYKKT